MIDEKRQPGSGSNRNSRAAATNNGEPATDIADRRAEELRELGVEVGQVLTKAKRIQEHFGLETDSEDVLGFTAEILGLFIAAGLNLVAALSLRDRDAKCDSDEDAETSPEVLWLIREVPEARAMLAKFVLLNRRLVSLDNRLKKLEQA